MELKILMPNFYEVTCGDIKMWFSYTTPIAYKYFDIDSIEVFISKNIWTKTTGKHINYIKQNYVYMQVDNDEFNEMLDDLIK